jgi:hypothetical protein
MERVTFMYTVYVSTYYVSMVSACGKEARAIPFGSAQGRL